MLSFLVLSMIYFTNGDDGSRKVDDRYWPGLLHSVLFSHELRYYETAKPENIPPGDSVDELESRMLYLGGGLAVDPFRLGTEIVSLILVTVFVVNKWGGQSRIGWLTCCRLIASTVMWIAWGSLRNYAPPTSSLDFCIGWAIILSFPGNMIWSGVVSKRWFDRIAHGMWFAGTMNFAMWISAIALRGRGTTGLEFQKHFWLSFAFAATVTTLSSRPWRSDERITDAAHL